MKHFIYLDTDIVSSIIAQVERGYITQETIESGNETTKTKERTVSARGEVSGVASFWKLLQSEARLSLSGDWHDGNTLQSSSKEFKEKVLHDAAFDIAYEYIQPYKSLPGKQDQDEDGNYLEIKRIYDFVDFDYLENLFQKDGVFDLIKKTNAEKMESTIEQTVSGYSREQRRIAGNTVRNEMNKAKAASEKQINDAGAMIHAFRSLIPYSRMLVSRDGYLIPLDDKYFRIDPSNLGFKYGGEMTCVGIVTNIIGESTEPDDSKDMFALLQFQVNEFLRKILPSKESDLCVIHPIAVYYGK